MQLLFSRLRLFKNLSAKKVAEGSDRAAGSTGPSSNNPERFYDLLLETCERLFDNEIDQHVFEDQVRHVFGLKVSLNSKEVECIMRIVAGHL